MDVTSYLLGKKSGGTTPTGTINITNNGTHNVSSYATAEVAVPQPSGKIEITQNGTDIDVSSYATADVNVSSGGKLQFSSVCQFSFYGSTLNSTQMQTQIDNICNAIDTSTITKMSFGSCTNVTSLDLSNVDSSGMTDMGSMFSGCSSLTSLDLTDFDTSNVTGMGAMFVNCYNLTSLDLSSFTSESLTSIANMFKSCERLMHLDIRGLDLPTITTATTFLGPVGSSGGHNTNVPTNCEIIVKDNTVKQWMNTNFTNWKNVKTVAEYEG